jgi:hypothetical protein
MWNANLMQQGTFIDIFLAQHVSGTYAHHLEHGTIHTVHATQRLSRPPPIQKLGAENHMLQLNI